MGVRDVLPVKMSQLWDDLPLEMKALLGVSCGMLVSVAAITVATTSYVSPFRASHAYLEAHCSEDDDEAWCIEAKRHLQNPSLLRRSQL